MKRVCLWSGLTLLMATAVLSEEAPATLFEFSAADSASKWQTVNDGVMGGVSEGKMKINDSQKLEFFGNLSLENNGGFASVRTKPGKLEMTKGDTLIVRVRGDGREYYLNLFAIKALMAFSYRANLPTKKDEWIEVKFPLDTFEATSFGRVLKNAAPMDPKEINAVGFMLADKKAGPFLMEIAWIKLVRASEPK